MEVIRPILLVVLLSFSSPAALTLQSPFYAANLRSANTAVFDPTTLSNLIAGYIFDTGITSITGRVIGVTDSGPNAYNLWPGNSNTTGTRMPKVFTDSTSGKKYMRVDFSEYAGQYMLNTNVASSGSAAIVIFGRFDSVATNMSDHYLMDFGGQMLYTKLEAQDMNLLKVYGSSLAGSRADWTNTMNSTWGVIFGEIRSGSGNSYVKINNLSITNTGNAGTPGSGTKIQLGANKFSYHEVWIYRGWTNTTFFLSNNWGNFVARANTLYKYNIAP